MKDIVIGSAEKRRYNLTLTWIHLGVIVISTLVILALIIGCCRMFGYSIENERMMSESILHRDSLISARLSKPVSIELDTLGRPLANSGQIISLIKEVEERQSEYFSDLRQESNNIINKFNAWLGFWIAILTIFGAVIPIVIQYILHQKSKRDIESMFDKLQKKALNHQLLLAVSGVYISNDCDAIRDTSAQEKLMNTLIEETYVSFKSIVELIDNSQGYLDRESEIYLINSLVQYSRLVNILKEKCKYRETRRLTFLADKIKELISDITKREEVSRDIIWRRVLDLMPELGALRWN